MIKRMSNEYVAEYSSTEPSRPCPKEVVEDDLTADDKMANAKAIRSAFMSMFGNKDKTPAVAAENT